MSFFYISVYFITVFLVKIIKLCLRKSEICFPQKSNINTVEAALDLKVRL